MELKLEYIEQRVGAQTHLYPLSLKLVPLAVTVLLGAVGDHAALGRRVEPGHHPHKRRLAGLCRPEQHRHGQRHEREVERIQVRLRTDPLLDAFELQFHARSVFIAAALGAGDQCAAHQSATAARCASFRCRPSLLRRHSTSAALRAHSCSCR